MYLISKSFKLFGFPIFWVFKRTWWRLLQERNMGTKLDIYIGIICTMPSTFLINLCDNLNNYWVELKWNNKIIKNLEKISLPITYVVHNTGMIILDGEWQIIVKLVKRKNEQFNSQLYHDQNKLHCNWMMMPALYYTMSMMPAFWKNNPRIDMWHNSDTLP